MAEYKLIGQSGYAGIIAGAAIAAAALAQIANLYSKPLPAAYGKGTDNHPGGGAIVGELYKPELVEPKGGKAFITDRPMLLNNLPAGSKVTPLTSSDLMTGMSGGSMAKIGQRIGIVQVDGSRAVIEAIEHTGRMTVQALKKQKGSTVNVNVNGVFATHINKYVTT